MRYHVVYFCTLRISLVGFAANTRLLQVEHLRNIKEQMWPRSRMIYWLVLQLSVCTGVRTAGKTGILYRTLNGKFILFLHVHVCAHVCLPVGFLADSVNDRLSPLTGVLC